MRPSELAYYLYCLTPCGCEHPCLCDRGGWAPSASWSRDCGEDCAVYSEVELGEFAASRRKRTCRTWLGWDRASAATKRSIEEIMSQAPVLPARFATLFYLAGQPASSSFSNTGRPSPDSSPSSATSRSGPSKGCWIAAGALEGLVASRPAAEERALALPRERDISGEADQGPVGTGVQPTAERILPAGGGGAGRNMPAASGNARYWRRWRREPGPRSY